MDFVEIIIDRPLPVDRDDVEDNLNEYLVGMAQVTGAGTWQAGTNLDLEVSPTADRASVLNAVFEVLARLGLGNVVRVRPGDSEKWIRPSEWRD